MLGLNAYDNNADTSDVCGHGTAVVGTAAGVAGKAKILPIRIAAPDPATGNYYCYYKSKTAYITCLAIDKKQGKRVKYIDHSCL